MNCHIQIFLNNRWQTAAVFEPNPTTLDRGVEGGCLLEYKHEYAIDNLGNQDAELLPGLPVGFELFRFKQWPPFLLDLLPGGAGRAAWLKRLQVERDSAQFDWHLLLHGAGAPPGNLRIAEAVLPPPSDHFKIGFPRRDIIERRENFLEYAEERGAHVAGASSVQGEAPKYLVVQDHNGMFHAEGSLEDERQGDQPRWGNISETLDYVLDPDETRTWLYSQADKVKRLPEIMRSCLVDDDIIQRLSVRIENVAMGLMETRQS
ncbi:MAG: hypothetical protein GX654_06465 [Desulfatiglans sp.]|nr:hypothetical protein [Desulfatiglans sp.]